MSGHSHWATIKHKKGATDAKKGKMFSKVARLIMIAAKEGGGDPTMNLRLQYAIDKAKSVNMPKDNVDRAIKKGTGELEGISFEESMFEGYGHGGAAIMVEVLTDNKNRTSHEIRKIFEANGGSLGGANCVSWIFERKGLITIAGNAASEDQILSDALDAGAEDASLAGDAFEITCAIADFEKIKKALSAKYKLQSAELTKIPKNYVTVNETDAKRLLSFMDALEEHDDVQNVYSNFEVPQTLTAEKT